MTQEEMFAEFQKMQAEINAMKQTISEQSRQLKTINSFLSAMTAAQDFEKTMIEVESVTEQITECEKAEFYCYDSSENKFFTSGGDYREWQDILNADELKNAMKNTEITFTDNGKKALIPVASSDNTVIGIVSAVKEQGFEKTDLSPLKKGSEIISTIDLAVQKEMNHRTAVTDELTKLKNRDGLNEYLKKTMVNSLNENKTVNIVMCDIDKFKSINDTYGHDAGDIILKGVADVLRNGTRTGADCAFRMGGEEMVCILNCSPEKAVDIAEQLRMRVENTVHSIIHEGAPLDKTVTVSMGVHTMKPTEYATPENIRSIFDSEFKNADNAVYEAKETGRNKVVAADENVYKGYMAQKAAEIICAVNSAPESIPSVKSDILSCFAENDISSISDAVLSAADELTDKNMQQTAENLLTRLSEYAAKKPVIDTELDDPEIVGTAEFIHESNKDRLESFDPVKAEKALEAVTEKCDISAEKAEQLDEKLNDIAEKQQERQSGGYER